MTKPFLKWAGGKRGLLGEIQAALPADFASRPRTYVEPFVGGGAVLFWILSSYPGIERAIIGDINLHLIGVWRAVQRDCDMLIAHLSQLEREYLPLDADRRTSYYLRQRERFNALPFGGALSAALLLFLNRTCFNGLYRVNSKGVFNVAHGRYTNPRILDEGNLRAASNLLQRVDIQGGDFEQTMRHASPDSLYYLDPPYKPVSTPASFNAYASGGFDDGEQERLADFCRRLDKAGALFIASNSNPGGDFFDRIFAGFATRRVQAKRVINSVGANRGSVSEILVTNILN